MIHVPFNRLSVYQNSYFPCTIQAWNSLDLTIRNLPTFSSFKLKLQQIFYTKRRNPQYYSIGDRFLSVLHSRMRNKYSALNADLYHVNYNCLCGYSNENAQHYSLGKRTESHRTKSHKTPKTESHRTKSHKTPKTKSHNLYFCM